MSKMLGFWSYVHDDDDLDSGRVSDLARDLVANYSGLTAESIELFLDRDDLHWGDDWRSRVDDALSNVAFFVPVLTPRYFKSVECRRELKFFLDRTEDLGIEQLVMPIHYINVPALAEENPTDPLVAELKRRQWEPWFSLRFEDRSSGTYRSNVARLAQQIADRAAEIEAVDVTAAAQKVHDEFDLGVLDRIARLEETMPQWNSTMGDITQAIQDIGALMRSSSTDIQRSDAQGKGFAARLVIARRVAGELEAPVARIEESAQRWVTELDHIDSGIRAVVQQAKTGSEKDGGFSRFFEGVRRLSLSASQGLGGVTSMANSIESVSAMSKDLRPALRRLRAGLMSMYEGKEITDRWIALLDEVDPQS